MGQEKSLGALEFRSVKIEDNARADNGDLEIDLRELAGKIWHGKWIIAITTFVAGVLGLLVASQFEATYTATTKVLFELEEATVVDVGQSVVRTDDTLYNKVEVLQSSRLIDRVTTKLNLEQSPEFNYALRPPETGPMTLIRQWISIPSGVRTVLRDMGILPPPPPPADADQRAIRQRLFVLDNVRGALRLDPIEDSTVIDISITTRDPYLSARVANTFASEFIVDQLDAKLEATREATTWLADRVEELRIRVEEAEASVEAARAEISLASGQGIDVTRSQINALNGALSTARSDAARARAEYDRLFAALQDNRDLGAISAFRSSNLIRSYRDQRAELSAQRNTLADRVDEGHPALTRVDNQIEDLDADIRLEAERIVDASLLDREAADQRVVELETELRTLEDRALDQGQASIRIRQLEREADASRVLYENFLNRLKETSEQEALQTADARVLSQAEVPLYANMASRKRTIALALFVGALLGAAIVLLLDKLNNTFRSAAQLEEMTGHSILGALPAVGWRLKRRDVVEYFRSKPKSALAEAVRSLRTSILFSNVDKPPKTVMFTSSVPREGKSTASMLMALTSQQMGRSAVIIDCDLRLPSLARLLPADTGPMGILSVIDGTATLDEAIYRDPETGLDVLMTKPDEPRSTINPADILSSNRFREILSALKARYDLVIIDSPPTLVVTDAKILARQVDAVVYAVHWDQTPRGAVLEGLKDLRSVGAPIVGTCFTMLNEARAAKYAYEGYAYYKTRYRDYYVN